MSPLPKAVVTLLTNSSYLPGALVLLHSLKEQHPAPRDFQIVCLVTPETVSAKTIGALQTAGYDLIIGVEPILSGPTGQAGLRLMGRPDLNMALTKLHIFRLDNLFSSIIYLDADTLPLAPLAHLFDLTKEHVFSACPDIGWPDCFNSGVMVIRPQSLDFEGLRAMMTASTNTNGSFDGADQGLLNEYFSEDGPGGQWNRLPFIYNVTPSAAYQYAPAYKRYARKISLIHFIGSNKPWSNLRGRASGHALPDQPAFDYNSLVDRWYDVYDRHVRPTAVHEPNLAKRFTVPEHVAVWNAGTESASQPARLSLSELKTAAQQGVAALNQGQYTALPLEGRVDLIAPMPQNAPPAAAPTQDRGHPSNSRSEGTNEAAASQKTDAKPSDAHADQHHPTATEHPTAVQPAAEQPTAEQPPAEHPTAPPNTVWDGSRYAPPKQSQPEMVIPMKTVYAPAWDEPLKSQTSYFQTHKDNVDQYPSLPENVQKNDWYQEFTATIPDNLNVKPVFPWEEEKVHRTTATRTFPVNERSLPLAPPPKTSSQKTISTSSKEADPEKPPRKIAAPPVQTPVTTWKPAPSMAEAMASYTNAWDNVTSIDKYANSLTRLGIGTDRRSALGGPLHNPHRRHGDKRPSQDSVGGYAHAASQTLYQDKYSQTDPPSQSDAKVQASPELSPVLDAQDKQLKIALRLPAGRSTTARSTTVRSTTARSTTARSTGARSTTAQSSTSRSTTAARPWPTYSFETASGSTRTKTGGRVWDPETELKAIRVVGSQHILGPKERT